MGPLATTRLVLSRIDDAEPLAARRTRGHPVPLRHRDLLARAPAPWAHALVLSRPLRCFPRLQQVVLAHFRGPIVLRL